MSAAIMKKIIISTESAPPAIGPYSQAVRIGDLLFASGQIPLDPANPSAAFSDDVTAQADRVLENIRGLLQSQGLAFENVVKSTVFLTDMGDFAAMNAVYSKYFTASHPARSTIQVAGLPRGAKVEIEVVAHY
jgi:2-iminobutanoate/2-iminopropanoate deaminase